MYDLHAGRVTLVEFGKPCLISQGENGERKNHSAIDIRVPGGCDWRAELQAKSLPQQAYTGAAQGPVEVSEANPHNSIFE